MEIPLIYMILSHCTLLINCRTTHNKKVSSFGLSSDSETEPKLDNASYSAVEATQTGETVNQTDSTNNADEEEDTILRRVISDSCGSDSEETSDEIESEDVQEGETAESVSQETALVENAMVEDTLCQVKSSCAHAFKSTSVVPFHINKEKLQRG